MYGVNKRTLRMAAAAAGLAAVVYGGTGQAWADDVDGEPPAAESLDSSNSPDGSSPEPADTAPAGVDETGAGPSHSEPPDPGPAVSEPSGEEPDSEAPAVDSADQEAPAPPAIGQNDPPSSSPKAPRASWKLPESPEPGIPMREKPGSRGAGDGAPSSTLDADSIDAGQQPAAKSRSGRPLVTMTPRSGRSALAVQVHTVPDTARVPEVGSVWSNPSPVPSPVAPGWLAIFGSQNWMTSDPAAPGESPLGWVLLWFSRRQMGGQDGVGALAQTQSVVASTSAQEPGPIRAIREAACFAGCLGIYNGQSFNHSYYSWGAAVPGELGVWDRVQVTGAPEFTTVVTLESMPTATTRPDGFGNEVPVEYWVVTYAQHHDHDAGHFADEDELVPVAARPLAAGMSVEYNATDPGGVHEHLVYEVYAFPVGGVPQAVLNLPQEVPTDPTDPTDPRDPTDPDDPGPTDPDDPDPTAPTDPSDPTSPEPSWPGFPWEAGFNEESWEAFSTAVGNLPGMEKPMAVVSMFVDGYQYGTCLVNGDADCLADELGDIVGGFVGVFVPGPFSDMVSDFVGDAVTDGIHDLFDF